MNISCPPPVSSVSSERIGSAEASAWALLGSLLEKVKARRAGKDLRSIESFVFKAALEIARYVEVAAVESFGSGDVGLSIEVGGETLRRQGEKSVNYLSVFGEIRIARTGYWKKGSPMVFPLDAELNMPERKYSYLLSELCQHEAVDKAFDKSLDSVSKIFGVNISKLGLEKMVAETSRDFDAFNRGRPDFPEGLEGEVIGIAADCKGVRMVPSERNPVSADDERDGKRKMAVVSCDFEFNPRPRTADETLKGMMDGIMGRPHGPARKDEDDWAINTQSAAAMYGKTKAFDALADRIVRRDREADKKIVVLVDGEKALAERLMEVFADRGMLKRVDSVVLDIIHVSEYVCETAAALYGARPCAKKEKWIEKMMSLILHGKAAEAVASMRRMMKTRWPPPGARSLLYRAATYFDNHLHMMRYDHYLAMGYPIATGIVEGACGSLVKDRMDDAGARWTAKGAQAVLNMRAIKRNGAWDEFWMFHMENERKRLYGKFLKLA